MFLSVHVEIAWGKTEISHMHINGASSKRIACHCLTGLEDKENTEVFQGQQTKISKFLFVAVRYFIELFFYPIFSHQSVCI